MSFSLMYSKPIFVGDVDVYIYIPVGTWSSQTVLEDKGVVFNTINFDPLVFHG